MGRRIALTTPTARSSPTPHRTAPPCRPRRRRVDPLHTDTYTEPGAQLSGLDPRVVGPYRLTAKERVQLAKLAKNRQACFQTERRRHDHHDDAERPPVLTDADGNVDANGECAEPCADGKLNTPTATESKALKNLITRAQPCLKE
jgi:two-component system sensor histidine kinase BaeS